MRNSLTTKWLVIIGAAGCSIACHGAEQAPAPNLLINAARIASIKDGVKSGDPAILAAYKQLISDADACLNLTPDPIVGELKVPGFYKKPEEQRKIVGKLKRDAKAANCLALAYAVSDDEKYGLKAKEFLFAWVNNLGKPRDAGSWVDVLTLSQRGDTPLVISYTFPNFIYAFDVLDGLGMLSAAEAESFRKWLRIYVDYYSKECLYKNNHHNWQSLFLMCAGHALRDQALFEKAVTYYKNGFRIQLTKDGAMPMELWREEKCGTYTLMALEAMLQGAYIASNHGHSEILDLKSKDGGDLKSAVDCLISFLNDSDNWQVKRRKEFVAFKKQNRPDNVSDWGWAFELPYYWWKNDEYLASMQKRPYGEGIRAYSLSYSTLLFAK